MERRYTSLAALAAIGLAVLAAGCARTEPLPVLPLGGDFTLTDHHGEPFTLSALDADAVLVFFGFTHCPDACPITLSKLSTVARRLGEVRARLKTVYISVDPARDTPEVLAAHLANFDLDAIGLTGTTEQIDAVASLFGASYEIAPRSDPDANYSVAHTTTVYLLDGEARTRLVFHYEDPADLIVEGVRRVLAAAG